MKVLEMLASLRRFDTAVVFLMACREHNVLTEKDEKLGQFFFVFLGIFPNI